jgi:hypothetical protein
LSLRAEKESPAFAGETLTEADPEFLGLVILCLHVRLFITTINGAETMLSSQQSQTQSLCITVSTQTLAILLGSIHGCYNCSDNAEIPFAQLVESAAGYFMSGREYVFAEDVRCSSCMSAIDSDSFIEVQRCLRASAAECGVAALTAWEHQRRSA